MSIYFFIMCLFQWNVSTTRARTNSSLYSQHLEGCPAHTGCWINIGEKKLNEQWHLTVLITIFSKCEEHLKNKTKYLKLNINIKKRLPQLCISLVKVMKLKASVYSTFFTIGWLMSYSVSLLFITELTKLYEWLIHTTLTSHVPINLTFVATFLNDQTFRPPHLFPGRNLIWLVHCCILGA